MVDISNRIFLILFLYSNTAIATQSTNHGSSKEPNVISIGSGACTLGFDRMNLVT